MFPGHCGHGITGAIWPDENGDGPSEITLPLGVDVAATIRCFMIVLLSNNTFFYHCPSQQEKYNLTLLSLFSDTIRCFNIVILSYNTVFYHCPPQLKYGVLSLSSSATIRCFIIVLVGEKLN